MTYREGQPVRIRGLGTGIVRAVRRDGRCTVEVGNARLLCRPEDLEPVPAERAARRRKSARPSGPLDAPPPADRAATRRLGRLDLHGLTVEEALRAVDDRLNDALLAGLTRVEIVHGKGQGRIRAALHRHLRTMPAIRRFELDDRNTGVTYVDL